MVSQHWKIFGLAPSAWNRFQGGLGNGLGAQKAAKRFRSAEGGKTFWERRRRQNVACYAGESAYGERGAGGEWIETNSNWRLSAPKRPQYWRVSRIEIVCCQAGGRQECRNESANESSFEDCVTRLFTCLLSSFQTKLWPFCESYWGVFDLWLIKMTGYYPQLRWLFRDLGLAC